MGKEGVTSLSQGIHGFWQNFYFRSQGPPFRELRTFAPKMFPRTDFFLSLPRRKVMICFAKKAKKKNKNKKIGGHRARFRNHEVHFWKLALF